MRRDNISVILAFASEDAGKKKPSLSRMLGKITYVLLLQQSEPAMPKMIVSIGVVTKEVQLSKDRTSLTPLQRHRHRHPCGEVSTPYCRCRAMRFMR
jgi:hypothetical protein